MILPRNAYGSNQESPKLAQAPSRSYPLSSPSQGIPASPLDSKHIQNASGSIDALPECLPVTVVAKNLAVDVKGTPGSSPTEYQGVVKKLWKGTMSLLGASNLAVSKAPLKRILFDVSVSFEPYRLVALMGASGAGKSTLLNALSKRIDISEGSITLNGHPATEDNILANSAFVQQLDLFFPHITPNDHLKAQLLLRLPQSLTPALLKSRQDTLLQQMNLLKCADTPIGDGTGLGGLSGGERKRLNVASELCEWASVLYADEPTTGLDSFMAFSVLTTFRKLADSGRTIIATIHQPSTKIFNMFDDLILLAEGRLIYAGDRLGCVGWLGKLGMRCPPLCNPAEYIIQVVSIPNSGPARDEKLALIDRWATRWKEEGQQFLQYWEENGRETFVAEAKAFSEQQLHGSITSTIEHDQRKSMEMSLSRITTRMDLAPRHSIVSHSYSISVSNVAHPPELLPIKTREQTSTSWCRQTRILYRRALQGNFRDPILLYARAVQTIILAFLIGIIFFRRDWTENGAVSRLGGLYSVLMNQSMSGAFSVVNTFVEQKPVARREHESRVARPSAYLIAKMLADAPIQIFFPILFATITYWLMDLKADFLCFLVILCIALLVANTAMTMGYVASALGESTEVAAVICNLSVLPMTIFGGFLVNLDDTPKVLSWLKYLSFIYYGFRWAAQTVFQDTIVHLEGRDTTGAAFLNDKLGIVECPWYFYFILLCILLIVLRTLGCIAYSFSVRRNRENV